MQRWDLFSDKTNFRWKIIKKAKKARHRIRDAGLLREEGRGAGQAGKRAEIAIAL
ncbi:hypothetical protein [Alistipes senegalensis]|uniref:hypothetical protein n=1 Tax=Alistipes senegalensis TaxID=1288121 RepID=UPI00242E6074|nr:hypothetical protein [Alistipes senegalensis]